MSETVKLIIEIPKDAYRACRALRTDNDQGIITFCVVNAVANGVSLDDVKAEIEKLPLVLLAGNDHIDKDSVMQILDNIGKGDKE